jgi:hypothetical protein
MTKVVLRLLPSDLSEKGFDDFVGAKYLQKASWRAFYSGELSNRNSIAYVYFDKSKDAEEFVAELNGKVINKTNYKAVVSIAPFQRRPQRDDASPDGNLEDYSRYLQFMESMKSKAPLPPASTVSKSRDFKTPLVEYLEALQKKPLTKKTRVKTSK